MMNLPSATFIGTGRLGSAMIRAFNKCGISIKSIYNRDTEQATRLADRLDTGISSSFPKSKDDLGKIIFLTVSDSAIQGMAEKLSQFSDSWENYIVVHCSGNESAEILNPVCDRGAAVASFHPLQTFSRNAGLPNFQGIYFSLQGDKSTFPVLEKIASKLNAKTLYVTADQKAHLHVSAVLASNYLNSLLSASVETASLSGLESEEVKKALMPLITTSLENINESSFEDSLTGPIKRGDWQTVRQHLTLLEEHPHLLDIYITLGRETLNIAESSGNLDNETVKRIEEIFNRS